MIAFNIERKQSGFVVLGQWKVIKKGTRDEKAERGKSIRIEKGRRTKEILWLSAFCVFSLIYIRELIKQLVKWDENEPQYENNEEDHET